HVPVPHNRADMPLLDSAGLHAKELGAANTLLFGQNRNRAPIISGFNTDDKGFVGALRQAGFEPEDGGRVVVVGAGGAARGVVFGLLWSGSEEIMVLNRSLARAETLVSDLGRRSKDSSRLSALSLTVETLVESARTATLLVNATTVGMWPHVDKSIWPEKVPVPTHLTVFDLVYNPLETRLLQQTRRSGSHGVDGLGMLVRQGALALDMWTSMGLPVDEIAALMRTACERVLGR
ncbi:MAG: shikimate dehydrogenase, partial [Ardenticatenia bacterium]|nr:shikimate dehydrogenase [Ardenticatenia bacterium]